MPTPDDLRQLLRYEEESGKLFWRDRSPEMFPEGVDRSRECMAKRFASRYAGREAFTAISGGYFVGRVWGRLLKAHRVAWAMHNGAWPLKHIDHIDGNTMNNKLGNLRSVSPAENMRNTRRARNNKTGFTGVSWHDLSGKWRARASAEGREVFLGLFDSIEEAAEARRRSNPVLGYHENHGRG